MHYKYTGIAHTLELQNQMGLQTHWNYKHNRMTNAVGSQTLGLQTQGLHTHSITQ